MNEGSSFAIEAAFAMDAAKSLACKAKLKGVAEIAEACPDNGEGFFEKLEEAGFAPADMFDAARSDGYGCGIIDGWKSACIAFEAVGLVIPQGMKTLFAKLEKREGKDSKQQGPEDAGNSGVNRILGIN